jgi:hypothetical protein
MSWNLSTLRKLAFAVVSICLVLPAAAQQTEPEEEVAAAPAEDPSEAEQQAFYAERLRTAPPEVKEVLSKLDSQRTANMTFRMGYTTALDRNLQELTGAKKGPPPGDLKAKMQRADKAMEVYRQLRSAERLPAPGASCNPTAKTFSWRKLNKVTPVKDQGVCGSCWAFSSAAAYESSNAILNNKLVDASEQDLMDCSEGTNCIGNWVQNAFARLITAGTTTERKRPYAGQVQQCAANLDRPYRAVVWAPLDADWSRVMTPAEIKSKSMRVWTAGRAYLCDAEFPCLCLRRVYPVRAGDPRERRLPCHHHHRLGRKSAGLGDQELLGHRLGTRRLRPRKIRGQSDRPPIARGGRHAGCTQPRSDQLAA